MPLPNTEYSRRTVRWLWPAALLALTPKCLFCVLAYAGLGAALGLGGPELCSASSGSPSSWAASLGWLGLVGSLGALGLFTHRRYGRSMAEGKVNSTLKSDGG